MFENNNRISVVGSTEFPDGIGDIIDYYVGIKGHSIKVQFDGHCGSPGIVRWINTYDPKLIITQVVEA